MKSKMAAWVVVHTELRQRRAYLLWWGVAIIALVGLTVLAYGSIHGQAAELNHAFDHLSDSIGSFVGTSDMFSPIGYLNSQLYFITLPILFILLSVTLANSLLNKEERRGTLELLLARPISRSSLLLAKAVTGGVVMAILGIVTFLTVWLCSWAAHMDIAAGYLLLTTVAMVLFSGAFGALAFMLFAASRPTRRLAIPVAVLISFGGYILASLSGLVHGLDWAAKLLPYHYYNPGAMLHGHLSIGLVIYVLAIYVGSLLIALLGFRRRDIG